MRKRPPEVESIATPDQTCQGKLFSMVRGFRYRPISMAPAKGLARGADLTHRLIKPQFGLGFTGAIVKWNVDGSTTLQSTYNFGRYAFQGAS